MGQIIPFRRRQRGSADLAIVAAWAAIVALLVAVWTGVARLMLSLV